MLLNNNGKLLGHMISKSDREYVLCAISSQKILCDNNDEIRDRNASALSSLSLTSLFFHIPYYFKLLLSHTDIHCGASLDTNRKHLPGWKHGQVTQIQQII